MKLTPADYYIPTPPTVTTTAERFGVALDIGTTTLTAALVDLSGGGLTAAVSAVNSGRRYGADVLSRLAAANAGAAAELQQRLQRDADRLVERLLTETATPADRIERLTVAANTTMQHLLLGYDTAGLGVAPFTPATLAPETKTYPHIFGNDTLTCAVALIPSASAFIGGDVIAGALTVTAAPPWLLIDLGTNGELLLYTGDRYLAASAAAGPAFEGGCLSCGVGSVSGAINRVRMRGYTPLCQTIGDQLAIGLCGSGAVEALHELRQIGLIDADGGLHSRFADGFPLTPEVTLTQADIRQLQMAKAAIRTAAARLLRQAELPASAITALLAGGFGAELDTVRAKGIGLLPGNLPTVAVGNTALLGAAAATADPTLLQKAATVAGAVTVIDLANAPDFEGEYLGNMRL